MPCDALLMRQHMVLLGRCKSLVRRVFTSGQCMCSPGAPSFNVLLTRRHMALVPRSREAWGPVSINSMGYAGSLLVRSREELDYIEAEGPLRILTEVGQPW